MKVKNVFLYTDASNEEGKQKRKQLYQTLHIQLVLRSDHVEDEKRHRRKLSE